MFLVQSSVLAEWTSESSYRMAQKKSKKSIDFRCRKTILNDVSLTAGFANQVAFAKGKSATDNTNEKAGKFRVSYFITSNIAKWF